MKIHIPFVVSSLAMVLSFGAGGNGLGQSPASSPLPNKPGGPDPQNAVTRLNKASGLIGTEVRNSADEKLGEIKDLVVDLRTAKIGYVVLGVGGFLGIGDKYIAVPPSAFTAASDQQNLVLNADKAKIQNAPGFAKNNWPDPNDPSAAAAVVYWQPANSGQGTPATAASTGSSTATEQTFRGRIIAIDPEAKSLSVKGPAGTREFKFANHPTVLLKDHPNARMSDLKAGYSVVIGYHEENNRSIVDSVMRPEDSPAK